MQDTWCHLLLIFGLASPLVPAAVLQTAATNRSAPPTTLLTKMSGNRTAVTQPLADGELLPNTPVDLPMSTTRLHVKVPANATTGHLIPTARIDLPASNGSATVLSVNSTGMLSLTDSDLIPTTSTNIPTLTTSSTSTTSTTSDTLTSADPTNTQSLGDVESTFDPVPTTSPTLSVQSDTQVPTPTPGSIAIINGIPTRVLNDTIQQQPAPIYADTASPNSFIGTDLNQPWNTSYPGPIHDDDWVKYLQIWDPVWWSTNLDAFRQTSCLCSDEDFLTNRNAKVAAYMNFEYYSHNTRSVHSLDWACGPMASSMSLNERVTSAKGKSEICWQAAGGEYAGDHVKFPEIKVGYYCDKRGELCVKPWRDGQRAFKYHGHKRNYDRDGVHTWSEIQPVVSKVCAPKCQSMYRMRFDDMNHHNPSFVTTFYPPKPVDMTMNGD